ncbi:hypothetical protein ACHA9J_002896 [Klebsiella oxytoca]
MSKFESGKVHAGITLVVLDFTQTGNMEFYPVVWADKGVMNGDEPYYRMSVPGTGLLLQP